jgi:DNA polymerase
MAYAFDDGETKLWVPSLEDCPPLLKEHIESGGILVAHNAAFERIIFEYIMGPRYGWPVPNLRQWRCTMAMAYAMALPGSLEEASAAVGLSERKDMSGRRLMLSMAKPRRRNPDGTFVWWDEPERLARLYAYCKQDVEVERALEKRLLPLRPQEQWIWFLDQEINDRGVYIDRALCEAALEVVEKAQIQLNKEMKILTDGAVSACSEVSAIVAWLRARGIPAEGLNKENINEMLAGWDMDDTARMVLLLRKESAKTSTAKVKKMLSMRADDGRMRGNLQYHGAGTGRWAARGAQLQNLPRPTIEDVPGAIDTILSSPSPGLLSVQYGPPLSVVSDCIRGMISAPPGQVIMSADFSNIEGRVTAWGAKQEDKVQAFRAFDEKRGPDLYLVAAGGIFGVSPADAKPFRQIGKVAELSLGFQGGPGAFGKMAGTYGLKIGDHYETVWNNARPEHRERAVDAWGSRGKTSGMSEKAWVASEIIKVAWRDAHPKIVAYWYALERAAMDAVCEPGKVFNVNGIIDYRKKGSFLWCRLPSGRALCYPYPVIKTAVTKWGEREALHYKTVDGLTRKWTEKVFYGGLACENVTQAIARDVMAEAMVRVDEAGFKPTITIHDEIVCEAPKSAHALDEFERLMSTNPSWAKDLPIATNAWADIRYRK